MEKKPIIIGLQHVEENLAACKSLIDYYAEQGIKSVGLEREPNTEIYARVIHFFMKKIEISSFFRQYLSMVLEDIQNNPLKENPFFEVLAEYAKQKGLEVKPIEGLMGIEHTLRLQFEKISKYVDNPHYIEMLKEIRPGQFTGIVFSTFFEPDYTTVVLRSEQMARRIQNSKTEVNFMGSAHAIFVARQLKIPGNNIVLIRDKKILTGKESEEYKIKLKTEYEILADKLKEERQKEKFEGHLKEKINGLIKKPEHKRPK